MNAPHFCPTSSDFGLDVKYQCASGDIDACGTCRKLSTLHDKIAETRSLLASLERECQKLNEEANYHHDWLIHRLPAEVASTIFEFCIPDDIMDLDLSNGSLSRYTVSAPLILAAVCRRWRDVALSTPRLWNVVPLIYSPTRTKVASERYILLVQNWINRSRQLPLSINFYSSADDTKDQGALDMIRLLDRYSDRWHKLKLNGPPALLDFFNKPDHGERERQQLRVLDLSIPAKLHNRNQTLCLNRGLRPAQLESLSIKGYMFVKFVNMNLNHLTQLTMVNVSLPACLEAVRIIPSLVNCIFEGCSMGRLNNDFLLPRKPIKNKTVQRLQFIGDGALFAAISYHLMCSSLESLLVNNTNGECQNSAYSIISFLEKSRCSLEYLSLIHVNLILDEEFKAVTSLCELMPTIRSLHLDFSGDFDSFPVHLFKVLSKFSIIDKRKVPQYIPLLSSLSLKSKKFYQWDSLLDIFGPRSPRSIARHRRALKHVTILVPDPHDRSVGERGNPAVTYNIDVPILKTILWLRDSAGVTWDVKSGCDEDDVIALAVRWYRGSGPVVRTAI